MSRLNLTIKHKFILLILFLVTLVSASIMVSTMLLSEDGKKKVLKGVSEKLEDIRKISVAEFGNFKKVADEGIREASGLTAIDRIISIAGTNQKEFLGLTNKSIKDVGDNVATTLDSQGETISKGLDDLLAGSTESMNEIMAFDNRSQNVLANVAVFNVEALKTSSLQSLHRLTLLVKGVEKRLQGMQNQSNEELDTLLMEFIVKFEDPEQDREQLVDFLMAAFENLKEKSDKRKVAIYQKLADDFDLQGRVMAEELALVTHKVRYAISRELDDSETMQTEKMDTVVNKILENQMAIHESVKTSTVKLSTAINELRINLPQSLKEKGEEAGIKVGEEVAKATKMAEEAKVKVAAKIGTNMKDAAGRFESGIVESKDFIGTTMDDSSTKTLNFSLGLAFICVLIAVFLGILIIRTIITPINRIIGGLSEGADQVASASGQVSASSQSLAEGSSEQAASIEETSASLEEMSSMTKQNADNSGQADSLMKEANQVIGEANESMTDLTHSMDEISKASEETSKIIKTIDEIAFQTNLLALNAAVEAARAGEAGAGFAVVADEVRNLALRAAEAAKNTAELIEGTVKRVNDGTDVVKKTNANFTKVAESATKVGDLVSEISAASKEQAQGIEEVNKAVTEMDKVTQQNAANSEESASASEEMTAQAEEMKGYVGDLVVLVGGKKGQAPTIHSRSAHRKAKRTASEKAKALPAPKRKQAARKAVNPEEVFPLDDKDFEDF